MPAQKEKTTNISLSFQELFKSYGEMLDIVKSIETFTRQTEILSLNPAVEAARAGNAGRGFKVISGEIKELALKSAQSNRKSAEQLEVIKNKVNDLFAARMADVAYDTIDKIDRNLFERNCDVQAWATFDKVMEAVETNDEEIYQQTTALLKNLVEIYEVYYDVFLTDINGAVIASGTNPNIIGKNMAEEEWFIDTIQKKKPTVIDMQYSEIVGGYTVGYNCPVLDRSNKVMGVLSTRFDWSYIYDIIDRAKISDSGQLLLINSSGLVIGSKNRDEVFKKSMSHIPVARKAMQGETYGYAIEARGSGSIDVIGYAHTRGYSAYKGKDWSVIAIETLQL